MTNVEMVLQGLVGGVISGALGLLIWHIKAQRADLADFQKTASEGLRNIVDNVSIIEKDNIKRDLKVDTVISAIAETKGSIETMRKDLKEQGEKIVQAMGKVDAAFRLLPNANKRASDFWSGKSE